MGENLRLSEILCILDEYSIASLFVNGFWLMSLFRRVKEWADTHRGSLLTFVGLLLIAVLAFEGGVARERLQAAETPLVITLPADPGEGVSPEAVPQETSLPRGGKTVREVSVTDSTPDANCTYVGSRNSNKYHRATCAVVKRIKPENRICFASKEEAEKRGYVPSCLQ